jgi:hypothetical protein
VNYRVIFYILIFCLTMGCGSKFMEYPPEPDLSDCYVATKQFETGLKKTPIPVPFKYKSTYELETDKPDNWSDFNGTIHLKSIKWNVTWISYLKVILDWFTVATWRDDEWRVSPTVDLKPFFTQKENNSSKLVFTVKFDSKGIKPARAVVIEAEMELYFCGENAALITEI